MKRTGQGILPAGLFIMVASLAFTQSDGLAREWKRGTEVDGRPIPEAMRMMEGPVAERGGGGLAMMDNNVDKFNKSVDLIKETKIKSDRESLPGKMNAPMMLDENKGKSKKPKRPEDKPGPELLPPQR